MATRGALRVTAPARTMVDCAASMTSREIERMLDAAWQRQYLNWAEIERVLASARRGAGRLRRILGLHTPGSTATRSGAEERVLARLRTTGLPAARVNARFGPWEIDFFWPAQRLAVEIDGRAFHSSPWAVARDAERDAWLARRGVRVLRVPSARVRRDLNGVLAEIEAALSG